jgi:hypothetical protein
MNTNEFQTIGVDKLRDKWAIYREYLLKACEYDVEKRLSIDGIYDALVEGNFHLIEIRNDAGIVAAAVFSVNEAGGTKHLTVNAIGGGDLDTWLSQFVEYLSYLAEGLGCKDGVIFCGRLGWQKKLTKLGFKGISILMHKGA